MLIHCGDVGSEGVLDHMVGTSSLFVFGNCDYDRESLRVILKIIGVVCRVFFADLELAGNRRGHPRR